MCALSIAALFSVADAVTTLTQPTVTVLNGTLRVTQCSSSDTDAFLSIPYAKPPVGNLRFVLPQPHHQKFNGILDATTPPPACVEFSSAFNKTTPESEDCLFIDVWVPANATADSRLPVRAWIFGGEDEAGGRIPAAPRAPIRYKSASTTELGPLGDQLLGLQLVQDNIAAFGGDPTRVMVFGQSAGAYNSWALSSLPQAKSLMHAAVLESGIYGPLANLTTQSQTNEPFLDALNCSKTDVSCLRSTSPEALVTTFAKMNNTPSFYGLTLDGIVIPKQPSTPLVPSIIGSTGNEGSLFAAGEFDYNFALNQTDYTKWLLDDWTPTQAALINETYPTSMFSSSLFPVFETMSLVFTHAYFRCPARRLLSATAATGVPVWTYSFSHTPSCPWSGGRQRGGAATAVLPDALGATHTSELPFYTASGAVGVNVANSSWEGGHVDCSLCDFWDRISGSATGTTNSTANGTGNGSGMDTGAGHTSGAMLMTAPWWANAVAVSCMLPALLFWV